ncbi:MAG: M61 family peptidase [Acidobacteriaceae bacterium]|nr:M61 family peptidase [Acidobacteriaceae bacterium]
MSVRTIVILPFALLVASLAFGQQAPIKITADLTDAPRKLYHAEIDIPVQPGVVSLTTPEWIPGTHQSYGPVNQIVGVVFTANGKRLEWRRDDEDLYQLHVTVPAGVATLHAHLDCIVTERVTQRLAVLEWEKLLLYPANTPVKEIPVQPTVIVPKGWGIGTAMTPVDGYDPQRSQYPAGGTAHFAATNIEQLQDSPVITGQYFHEYALAPEVTPKHFIDVVADAPEDTTLRPAFLASLNNLVRETGAAYGSRHYNVYHFLLTLSDVAGGEGLEHGQSSDNGVGEKGYADDIHQLAESDLLPHEFTHSWNGKYRRPFNLYQDDFHKMQQGSLLWVYEGMTQYLGNVLAARSGLKTQAQYRYMLAMSAANLAYKPGRQWRSTEDTAIASSILRARGPAWSNWRRGQDYYQEGELFWLDVDTLIRKQTGNKKSLTDFLHIFLGKGGDTGPLIVTYTLDELIADLNQVLPYDWAAFIRERIDNINPEADLAGIERGGYKLVFTDKPNATEHMALAAIGRRGVDVWYSVGLRVSSDGVIGDVRWGSAADKANLAPGAKIIAVNGNTFSPEALRAAITDAKGRAEPIHLILQSDTFVTLADIDYHDGERYPALERISGTPAYLDDITSPLTKPEKVPAVAEMKAE